MAKVIPFRGILYNTSKVSIEGVLAPPYDIITPEYREALYMQSPYNIVRIDFGKEELGDNEIENKYLRARRYFDEWMKEGIFIQSKNPSFYVYEMSYNIHSEKKKLIGFLGLVKLEELGKGSIYPHECTHAKPKLDRLNLMRSCKANTSPIFSLYKSSEKGISEVLLGISHEKPYIQDIDISGDVHRLWEINDTEKIKLIQKELENKAVFIADGHHRYETALEFYKEKNINEASSIDEPYGYVLMFLANMLSEGITILPTHRLLKEIPEDLNRMLPQYFDIEPVKDNFDIRKRLYDKRRVFGFFYKGSKEWYILHYKKGVLSEIHPDLREIDVIVLHELILKKLFHTADIGYDMDIKSTIDKVQNGEFVAAFFLNPTRVEDIEKAALLSVRMPPKSTYFYPKLLTGMVLNRWG